tara:strand:+ start:542 stop:1021 length:480 start_codon:yes stop_codon:yes gene_type:complete
MKLQTTYDKLTEYEVTDDTVVTFSWEDGADVFHYTDEHVDNAIAETGVIHSLASVLSDSSRVESVKEILQEMREEGYLEDYQRGGDSSFEDYLSDVISDEHWNHCWFEHSTKKYDHKRGFTTLSMSFNATVKEIKDSPRAFGGWEMQFTREDGARITLG